MSRVLVYVPKDLSFGGLRQLLFLLSVRQNRGTKITLYANKSILERVPTKISIKGSNNLDNWNYIVKNANIAFENEISNYNFENKEKLNYYLIEFINNENILRLYQVKFNRNLIPNNFKEVE